MSTKKNTRTPLTTLQRCQLLLEEAENTATQEDIADVYNDSETLVATAHPVKKKSSVSMVSKAFKSSSSR